MNATTRTALQDVKVHVRFKLAALWASVMSCYIYGDFLGLYRPGDVKGILNGQGLLGPTSQASLLVVAILVAVPAAMIFLSLVLPPALSRWLNILVGAILTAIVLVTIPGSWAFYIFLSAIEVVLQSLAVWYAWRWPRHALVF
ncbi:MAG TPA: DUF6326 family protein [Rhodanobacter sp.]|uniref:DUF6326 family protein n=1 Tax=Rhodanobacter sp. FW021-MT20 TaxID=1162282 RepID=UPI000260EC29|nr:DUF6326 family protein [Rhodanobacter sp. 115]EIL97372.1 hypothetical protein UU5_05336 [Rhodanobacter sp. 115]HWU77562.1 DUF6326 family protein [Rhodanobacter sp.]